MHPLAMRSILLCAVLSRLSSAVEFSRPVLFERNSDATPSSAAYVARTKDYHVLFAQNSPEFEIVTGSSRISFRFNNAAPAHLSPDGLAQSRSSYLIGSNPAKWRRNLENYTNLRYANIYPGVDAVFYAFGRQVEYDLVIAPGANPSHIELQVSGSKKLRIDREGNLVIDTDGGQIVQHRPKVYQERGGQKIAIDSRYRLHRDIVTLTLGSYDPTPRLIVDPVLSYATYLGGTKSDSGSRMVLDASGNVYVCGTTFSSDFPFTTGAFKTTGAGDSDMFVAKYNARGALVYSTYFGGNGTELGGGIAVDATGNVYITGATTSTNLPVTPGAFQTSIRGGTSGLDAFVSKLNATGTDVIYSTYLGGNDDEIAFGIAVDSTGSAYTTGATFSLNYPVTPNAFKSFTPGLPTYVTKLNPSGTALTYSTLVGGSRSDLPSGIAVDKDGNAFVVGDTSSVDFPTTTGAFQTTNRGGNDLRTDAFVFKLNPTGTALVYSTFIGGGSDELGSAIAIDAAGNVYAAGRTASLDFPATTGTPQKTLSGPTDAFIVKLNPAGSALVYASYFGGSRSEAATAIAVDSSLNAYLAGSTSPPGLSMTGASQPNLSGPQDAFVVKFNPAGSAILQGTYFGGPDGESADDIAVDSSGNVYLLGTTSSLSGVATSEAVQKNYGGGNSDVYLARFNFSDQAITFNTSPAQFSFQGSPTSNPPAQNLQINAASGAFPAWSVDATTVSGGNWLTVSPRSGSGTATVNVSVSTAGLQTGSYTANIVVTNLTLGTKTTVPVTLAVAAAGGQITQNGVVNAASFLAGGVAPGELVTLFGTGIGPAKLTTLQLTADGLVTSLLGETRVFFDDVPAPLIYVSANQVSAVVPYAVAAKPSTGVQVEYKGVRTNAVTLAVAKSTPAIFTADSSGKGVAAALNQDNSVNSASNPAPKESIVVLYATGAGQTDPAGVDGKPANDVYPKPSLPVSVKIGGKPAELLYGGAAPLFVAGILQVNVRIPADSASGLVPVEITVGTATTQSGVTIAVQ